MSEVPGRGESEHVCVGFGVREITPEVKANTVWLAGFGQGRRATGVNDPLYARALVLTQGKQKLALVSLDVVGLFYPEVKGIRVQLPDYDYILVSSTHNHEGPDTLGLWGPNLFTTGIDPQYMNRLRRGIIEAIREAERELSPCRVRYGMVRAPELLHDSRLPVVKHDELVVLEFVRHDDHNQRIGLLVQWNCHPETLGSKNTLVSADFVGVTVRALEERYKCRVAYFTGTVGGLLSSLGLPVRDEQGRLLADGTWEKTERYGILVARKAEEAVRRAKEIRFSPWRIRKKVVYLPVANRYYRAAAQFQVVVRERFLWTGNPHQCQEAPKDAKLDDLAIETEIGLLEFGELKVVAIPGEIYPELVVGGVQEPVDPGADYPDAPIEPIVYEEVQGPARMLIGLAND
ncbi:MAG: neutral/alkaline non-lysosomal ceramidase N-terminal domain-containing protein [Gemmatales bacterium]|nr:neutral/alkaline non-lysosomal ceramidase N-terminal domain-containing protein [Gemmatales bacterium]MDW8175977.1 neutral/alkaline non-lysosomal ceramidase N-terminal domain-containing protein [Gemmatales bacterium]